MENLTIKSKMGRGSGQKVNAYHVNRILIITFHMSGNWSNLSIKLNVKVNLTAMKIYTID